MSLILGLQTGHEASAVLFEGTRLLCALSNERVTRIKNDGESWSNVAIDAVLKLAGRERAEIGQLALLYTYFPENYFARESWFKEVERRLVRYKRQRKGAETPKILLCTLLEKLAARNKQFDDHFHRAEFLRGEGFGEKTSVRFHDHHTAHAVPAAYYSGFKECAVITIDGGGDGLHHTSGVWANGRYERHLASRNKGTSAGLFYGHVTQLLGFRPLRHEGKIVGLAALGDPKPLYEAFSKALRLSAAGLTLDSDFAGQPDAEDKRFAYMQQAIAGHSRENVSAAAQQILEDVAVALVRNFMASTGQSRVALNGGVFANVKLNQRIAQAADVDDLFVFPAMSDTGNSIGAVLLDLQAENPDCLKDNPPLHDVYWGPEYSDQEIAACLADAGLTGSLLGDGELIDVAARAIHDGQVVGWFQGRMEFGPRALGNRSMLARPTQNAINDWLNVRLDRSEFMPFAPSVLAERADEIFVGVDKARHAAEFMTVTFDVKDEWRRQIPAVVHVDGTARPQLVRSDRNPRYHQLISAYAALSGIPLVLNTSFNVHEEPIVCSPVEAIRAFTEKRVDCLGIGNYWLTHSV